MLINQSKSPFVIHIGDRIAQLVLERIAAAFIYKILYIGDYIYITTSKAEKNAFGPPASLLT